MIQLSDHFSYRRLLRFTYPTIIMMILTSVYSIVDGLFVANFVSKTSFAAVNFIFPVIVGLGAVGFMFGTGGSALVSKTMGEGEADKARALFSFIIYTSAAVGIVITALGTAFLRPIAALLGAEGEMLEDCVKYGRTLLMALPAFMLQIEFQSFFVTAEQPKLSLYISIAAGVTNMVLDALFVAVFRWGIVGAAIATGTSQVVGGLLPIIYFSKNETGPLYFVKCRFYGRELVKVCTNGASELMSNISMSVVGMLYNVQLMRYEGENGVAAYGVIMYINFVFQSIFIGYTLGVAPIVGYHYGAKNSDELKSLLRKSAILLGCFSVAMFAAGEILARPLSMMFVSYDKVLLELTVRAFVICSVSFLMSGFAIFGSGFFTALNDGLTSAMISFLRTFVFQIGAIILFPMLWDVDGIWWSIVAAEVMAVTVSLVFLIAKRRKYNYI